MATNERQLCFDFLKPYESGEKRSSIEAHRMRIAGHLTMRLPEPADVVFTNNRSTMISISRKGGRVKVRLHSLFQLADEHILEVLALYVGNRDKEASKALDEFILKYGTEIKALQKKRRRLAETVGKYYDLNAVLDRINKTYFEGQVDVRIGWRNAPARRRRQKSKTISRSLATYSFDDRSILVNSVLDSPNVPEFVVEWVVYHEVLHHVVPIEERRGKKLYHTERFRHLERAFSRYEDAKKWEKANLDKLLI